MKQRITRFTAVIALLIGLATPLVAAPATHAINVFDKGCAANGSTSVCGAKGDDATVQIKSVINVLLYILGTIAVIMIIIGGIRYATSNGDSSQTKAAKDTILYAVVGVVVAIMAYAIVNFVVTAFR